MGTPPHNFESPNMTRPDGQPHAQGLTRNQSTAGPAKAPTPAGTPVCPVRGSAGRPAYFFDAMPRSSRNSASEASAQSSDISSA